MEDLTALQECLRSQRPVDWAQLPDFPLYMDQVLSYMDRQVIRFDGNDNLTAAMVNNYTKSGLVPRAEGKKYNRDHLAYLTAICVLKQVLSAKDIDLLIRASTGSGSTPQQGYDEFCAGLDRALCAAADELEGRENADLAREAVHFALMSYAAGLVCERYVAILRQQAEAQEPAAKKSRKEHT